MTAIGIGLLIPFSIAVAAVFSGIELSPTIPSDHSCPFPPCIHSSWHGSFSDSCKHLYSKGLIKMKLARKGVERAIREMSGYGMAR
jgi:hypothetical protein